MVLVLTIADVSPETWCQDITTRTMLLGRDESADIRFDHRSVSRTHCRFSTEKDECYVEDCSSMNGVYVNARRIDKCKLQSGDRILIGKFELVVTKDTEIRETVEGVHCDTAEIPSRNAEEEIRHLASIVHERLTPSRRIGLPGLFVEVAYVPSGVLGGDCCFCMESGEQWVLAVFDAMHHGTKSALGLALLRTELERCVSLTPQPSRCLDWLNTELLSLGVNDLYTSACIATWFPKTQLLYYSMAGMPPPVLLRKGKEIELGEAADGLPLGVTMDEHYEEQLVQLKQKDRFFLFTDGASELYNPRPGIPLIRQMGRQLLAENHLPLHEHVGKFVDSVREQSHDDVLLIGCEVTNML